MLGIVLMISTACAWYLYYKNKDKLDRKYQDEIEHFKKHNCVVTFSKIHGITGWPGFPDETARIFCANCVDSFEPLLYFLNTTKETLDIAIMTISSNIITGTLISLARKGMRIRLLINYDHTMKLRVMKKLIDSGIEVVIYVGTHDSGSIFHYKYVIKDYNSNFSALCCGSMNWTNSAFLNNYENMVFTTNKIIIDEFYANYAKSLNYVKTLIKDDLYVKVKLEDLTNNMNAI